MISFYRLLSREIRFVKNWMLPISILVGVGLYLLLHFTSADEVPYMSFSRKAQPVLVGFMLFLQLNVVAPSDLRFHRWHFILLGVQASLFALFAFIASHSGSEDAKLLLECAMICLICPTAAAAGVITGKIGGSISGIMTYTVLSDTLASVLIPLMVPLVHPSADAGFFHSFWMIVRKVFSILILPLVAAWFIRYFIPSLQRFLARYLGWAFYIWGISLAMAMSLATGALVESGRGPWLAAGIALISLVCCLFQFYTGRRTARTYGRKEYITAGQALGQKNTGFIIWAGLSFLNPATSVAGGLYAIWQNLVNSWELWRARKEDLI